MAKTFTVDEVNMKVANACAKHIKAAERTAAKHKKEITKVVGDLVRVGASAAEIAKACGDTPANKKILAHAEKITKTVDKHAEVPA